MKNHKKLQCIFLLSVFPILACYTHNAYAAEVTVYKCSNLQSEVVGFQDAPCQNNEYMQVQTYSVSEASGNGLRPGEVAALDQMHIRQSLELMVKNHNN